MLYEVITINLNQIGGYAHLTYDLGKGFEVLGAARVDNHEIYGTNVIPKFGLLKKTDAGTYRFTYGQGIASPTILNLYGNLFSGLILGNAEGFTLIDGTKVKSQDVEKVNSFEVGYVITSYSIHYTKLYENCIYHLSFNKTWSYSIHIYSLSS